MAIKKSDLYSSLWASCDELRGGMDASQYKDYVLFMLFIKYVSDKYGDSDDMAPPVTIPKGAGFKDMIALKGKPDIGDKINKHIIQPLVEANSRLSKSDFPDFNDPNKLGEGNAMVERLSNLVAIFQKPELDFSKNRADNDDIDACMADLEGTTATLAELEEEHGGEDGFLGALDKINKAEVNARLKELRPGNAKPQLGAKGKKAAELGLGAPSEDAAETAILKQWLSLNTEEAELKKAIRDAETALDQLAYDQYPQLTEPEIQTLVVDDKWLTSLAAAVQSELDRVSQTLTSRIRLLADRYAAPLPQLIDEVESLAARVDSHLKKMGCQP